MLYSWFSVLIYLFYISIVYLISIVYIHQCQSLSLPHPLTTPLGIHIFVLYVCVSVSLLQVSLFIPLFLESTYVY